MRSLAERRHHSKRIKDKFRRKERLNSWLNKNPSDKDIGKLAAHSKLCSCWMCGNPRKFTGELTIQERKHMDDYDDNLGTE